jgi:hypothetical protein
MFSRLLYAWGKSFFQYQLKYEAEYVPELVWTLCEEVKMPANCRESNTVLVLQRACHCIHNICS